MFFVTLRSNLPGHSGTVGLAKGEDISWIDSEEVLSHSSSASNNVATVAFCRFFYFSSSRNPAPLST